MMLDGGRPDLPIIAAVAAVLAAFAIAIIAVHILARREARRSKLADLQRRSATYISHTHE